MQSPQELIDGMSRAARTLNYDGVFVYRRGRQIDTMRVIHQAEAGNERERLVSLTGPAREVIRNNQTVTCYFPDNKQVVVEKSKPRDLPSSHLPGPVDKIAEYYEFSLTGEDRTAGRNCWVVTIRPRDGFRYGHRLWIDKEHNLMLRSELYNEAGRVIEQILYTQLQVLPAIPAEALEPSVSAAGYTWNRIPETRPGTATPGGHLWSAGWMPNGFTMSNYEHQVMDGGKIPVEHLIYTDGLAVVYVFIEKLANPAQAVPGPTRRGAINAYTNFADGYQVTAVGEVPRNTVERMAVSIGAAR